MKERQILDVVLVANEAIDFMIKCANKEIICKLNIEEAFDHVI